MSGTRKHSLNLEHSGEDELPDQSFSCFNLDKEESFSLFFNEQQMRMELDDHLESLFPALSSPDSPPRIKEEAIDIEYIVSSPPSLSREDRPTGLNYYSDSVRTLQEKCRLVQQVIFATSTESIYDYEIGFESDEEEGRPEFFSFPYELEKNVAKSVEAFNPIKEEESESYERHCVKHEEDSSFGTKEHSGLKPPKKTVTLITVPQSSSLPFLSSWGIELVSKCYERPFSSEEKRRFLSIFDQLECMRRGIETRMTEINGNDHKCKVCGQQFGSGRMLGGHMSRKHPGNSYEYYLKKERLRTKLCERNRRRYMNHHKEGKHYSRTKAVVVSGDHK